MRIFVFHLKKLFVILLMFVYGFSASGMKVQFHYCCGKLKNVDWVPIKRSVCGKGHKMGSKPCCETKQLIANAIDHFNFQEAAKIIKDYEATLIHEFIIINYIAVGSQMVKAIIKSTRVDTSPLFLQHCAFRL